MAIVPLKKVTLYGAERRQAEVLELLQELGCAHLVDLTPAGPEPGTGDVEAGARKALHYLRSCPEQLRQLRRDEHFQMEKVVQEALKCGDEQRRVSDERDHLKGAIQELEPWGEFRIPSEGQIGGIRLWFFIVPLARQADLKLSEYVFHVVRRDHGSAYVVVLSEGQPEGIPGQRVELDSRPLSELRRRLEVAEEKWDELQYRRVGLTRWGDLLGQSLDAACDAADRAWANSYTLSSHRVFALQAWIPSAHVQEIRDFASQQKLAVTIESPGADDQPPTLLQNAEQLAGSESLVTFYKTPRYGTWDPSIISFFSFAMFFAMIVADAGYGFLLLVLTGFLWKKMEASENGRRLRSVLLVIDLSTILYGVICGSYFGVSPPEGSWLAQMQLLNAQSQSQMMPLTIGIGVVHLSLAHLINAWLQRGTSTALSSLGWVCVMLGAALAGTAILGDVGEELASRFRQIGEALLIGGLAAVVLFSSRRPLFSFSLKTHALRLLDGLRGLTNLSGLFGDALSYLRLFALGLASAKLSETFNGLGANAWDQAGLGVVAAIFIVLLGHTLNLALSIMSGVVHGLRLNCIEFYKWGLPDEGYSFKTFAKRAKEA